MYLKNFPDIVAYQSNQTSLDNSYDALNKVHPALEDGKKRVVKIGSNSKANIRPTKTGIWIASLIKHWKVRILR